MDTDIRRGGAAKSIAQILERIARTVAPSTAARSADGSVQRVRDYLRDDTSELVGMTPFAAVDHLFVVAGYCNKARNQRLLMARLLAARLGRDAPAVVLAILADIVRVDGAVLVGGCLAHRLRAIVDGRARDGFSGLVPVDLLSFLQAAFGLRQS
tara:strand:+ start:1761 stop:2225 length:465 start_codon:yes stop_codon:yes gene_type:complete